MIKLAVPLETQQKQSTCWHAAAYMLWRYSQNVTGRAGPMHTLRDKWEKNEAISPQEFINLARNVGLVSLPATTHRHHTAASLENCLKRNGPIWCAGFWYGPGHVIVLTGVDTNRVYLNDPDGGKAKTGTTNWFNSKLASQFIGCMMIKDPMRY